ncbi:MAG: ATP-binding cassette domain-containing protein, partial [Flavobacteriaceae bacterium]
IKDDEYKQFITQELQLEPYLDRYLRELSQGQFQKVKLATCLLQMTDYIVLDEPFAHLDLIQKERMNIFIQELVTNRNKCILLSTHHFDLNFKSNNHTLCLTSTQLKILNENSKERLIELLST